jgi:sugar transferase EpsL
MSFTLFPRGVPVTKRLLDLVLTIPGLVLVSPILAGVAIAVRVKMGGPVLFLQQRPGLRGEIFTNLKFRTMLNATDKNGLPLPDAQRITPLGQFLRASSLDELPELLNVLMGEMSLVGPRPLLVKYLERYSPEQARRHDVLPGITGWAQINGRNVLSWEDKFRLDVWYVDHWSIGLDLKILFTTIVKVLKREGISEPGQATAREFQGKEP